MRFGFGGGIAPRGRLMPLGPVKKTKNDCVPIRQSSPSRSGTPRDHNEIARDPMQYRGQRRSLPLRQISPSRHGRRRGRPTKCYAEPVPTLALASRA